MDASKEGRPFQNSPAYFIVDYTYGYMGAPGVARRGSLVNLTLPGLRFHALQTHKRPGPRPASPDPPASSNPHRSSPDPRPVLDWTHLKQFSSNSSVLPCHNGQKRKSLGVTPICPAFFQFAILVSGIRRSVLIPSDFSDLCDCCPSLHIVMPNIHFLPPPRKTALP